MPHRPIEVTVDVADDVTTIDYQSSIMATHELDYARLPKEEGGGQMRRLLCASAVGCYAASVAAALKGRGATVHACRGTGSVHATDDGRPIGRIDIRIEVVIDEGDEPVLARVRKILAGGCLVTHALEPAIDMTYEIVRVAR